MRRMLWAATLADSCWCGCFSRHDDHSASASRPVPLLLYTHGRTNATLSSPCNLIYIKVTKCASSTTGGVIRRIAAANDLSGVHSETWLTAEPGVWANHGKLADKWRSFQQLRQRSFLMTMVRLPAPRCLSGFYHFQVSRRRVEPNAANKIGWLSSCSDYIFQYIQPPTPSSDRQSGRQWTPRELVSNVYSFVGVAERYDESMVLLSWMLRVPLSDILYLKSKDSTAGGMDTSTGTAFVPHTSAEKEPEVVKLSISSAGFQANNSRDLELHILANAELDRKWHMNRKELDARLATFKRMLAKAAQLCSNAPPCYWNDNGCGYKCLDQHFAHKSSST